MKSLIFNVLTAYYYIYSSYFLILYANSLISEVISVNKKKKIKNIIYNKILVGNTINNLIDH